MTHVNDIRIVRVLVRTLFVVRNAFDGRESHFGQMLGCEKVLGCRGRFKKFHLLVRITSSRGVSEGLLIYDVPVTFDAQIRNRSLVFVD